MYARLFIAGLAALALTGCASVPNPFGTPTQASSSVGNAGSQPVAAPVVGAVSSSDPRFADLTKAGATPLTGAAIGSYMDQQEATLRAQLGSSGVSVTRVGQQIVVTLPAYLTFDAGKAVVKSAFTGTVASIGQLLKKYDKTVVDVYGYTDNQASEGAARDLSQRRAVAVATVLTNQGVDQRRFFIEGRGSQNPIGSNANEVGRAQNRRVEIQISPLITAAG